MADSSASYHHGNLPSVLLDAARAAITEHGAARLSLRDVARRAGVSHAAPAHHYGDKAGLLTALATQGYQRFGAAMAAAAQAAGPDPLTRLQACGVAYVMFAVNNRADFEVMFQKALLRLDDPKLAESATAAYGVLTEAIGRAQAAGHGAGRDPETLALGSWAAVHGLATLWLGGVLPAGGPDTELEALAHNVLGQHLASW